MRLRRAQSACFRVKLNLQFAIFDLPAHLIISALRDGRLANITPQNSRTHIGGRPHPQLLSAQVEGGPNLHGAPIQPARRLKITLRCKPDPIIIDSDSEPDPDSEGILVPTGKERVGQKRFIVTLKLGSRLKNIKKMPFEGVDLTADAAPIPYSWR